MSNLNFYDALLENKIFSVIYISMLTRIRDTIDFSNNNIYFIGVRIYFFIIVEFKNKDL